MEVKTASPPHRLLSTAKLGVAALILMMIVGLSYREWNHHRIANAEDARSRAIVAGCDRVLFSLVDAETGQRGYLLTGENSYLEPYSQAVQALPNELVNLKALVAERPDDSQDVNEMNALVEKELSELRQSIDLRRTQGTVPALTVVLSDQGRRTMDAIRALCARIQHNEDAAQGKASNDQQAAAELVLLVTVAGSLVLLFLFAAGFEPLLTADPKAKARPFGLRYGAAILAVGLSFLLRMALTPLIGPTELPFTFFFPAVLFSAWFGGLRVGVFSIALSTLAAGYRFAEPANTFLVVKRQDQVELLLFLLIGLGIALLSHSQRRAVERASRAEHEERNERHRFETTLASIGDAVIATDAEGKVTFANKIALSLVRWPEGETYGRKLDEVFQIVNEYTRATVESPVERALREGTIQALANHTVLIARDGTEVPIDDSAAPIWNTDGEIRGTVLVFRDITQRRRTERQIAEQAAQLERSVAEARTQQDRLSGIIDSAMDAIITIDESQRIQVFNHAAEQVFRCSASEMLHEPLEKLIPARFRHRHGSHTDQFGRSGVTARSMLRPGTLWGLRADGEEFPIEASISQVETAGGKLFTVILRDITERKQAERELRRESERLSLALTAGRMGVYEMDLARKVLWLSTESHALLGTTPGDFASPELFLKLVHSQDRELLLQHIKQSVEAHVPINHEFRFLRPDRKECWISCQGRVEYNEAARAVRHSGLLVDVTLHKRNEQVLRRWEKLAAAARLSAAMAHEINNPLGAVVNLIYLVKVLPDMPPAADQLLVEAEQELERVAHATRQTLGFYREPNAPEWIDIPALIESILQLYSKKLISRHISIERAFGECAPLLGVRGEVRQAVSNVIVNAIDAVEKGGVIIIGIQSVPGDRDGAAEIVIADNGPGIASEDVVRIFEPFFSTKGGTRTGLGLWVAKDIVERHGGSITVSSREEGSELGGAAFTITLPRVYRRRSEEPTTHDATSP